MKTTKASLLIFTFTFTLAFIANSCAGSPGAVAEKSKSAVNPLDGVWEGLTPGRDAYIRFYFQGNMLLTLQSEDGVKWDDYRSICSEFINTNNTLMLIPNLYSDREVVCIVYQISGDTLTLSLVDYDGTGDKITLSKTQIGKKSPVEGYWEGLFGKNQVWFRFIDDMVVALFGDDLEISYFYYSGNKLVIPYWDEMEFIHSENSLHISDEYAVLSGVDATLTKKQKPNPDQNITRNPLYGTWVLKDSNSTDPYDSFFIVCTTNAFRMPGRGWWRATYTDGKIITEEGDIPYSIVDETLHLKIEGRDYVMKRPE
ncbi:MAG: hypothetical protein LBF74_09810 [Treponema sp.]|nr:hypothetical protein [Treponema sp.]